MRQGYEKAVMLFNMMGKPSLFITFTGNPKWKEITEVCEANHSTWADNFDVVARVRY